MKNDKPETQQTAIIEQEYLPELQQFTMLEKPHLPERRQFAMMEKSHLRPGLFQATSHNRPLMAYEDSFSLKYGDLEACIDVRSSAVLTAFDALLLVAIMNKCKTKGYYTISPDNKSPVAQELRNKMELEKDARKEKTVIYETTMRELIKNMGLKWAGKCSIEMIQESLWRMFGVSFRFRYYNEEKNLTKEEFFHMLSSAKNKTENGKDGKLLVHLNVALARVIINPTNFAKIFIEDLLSLTSNEQIMYMQLCALVSSGQTKFITREDARFMLYGKIRPKEDRETINKQKTRAMQVITSVVKKLSGWTIVEKTREGIRIRREEETQAPKEYYSWRKKS